MQYMDNQEQPTYGLCDQEIKDKLDKQERVIGKASELIAFAPAAVIFLWFMPSLVSSIVNDIVAGHVSAEIGNTLAYALGICSIAMMVSLVFALALKPVFRAIRQHVAKPYVIEERKGLLRLIGKLHVTDLQNACNDLLSKRLGYRIVSGTPYGCVIAAIPEHNLLNQKKTIISMNQQDEKD